MGPVMAVLVAAGVATVVVVLLRVAEREEREQLDIRPALARRRERR